ncbi:hypothetical protein [Paenibacillus andongensis]|uniref:hypothetical protein n=1 Tax=Paenibacillus andongensis TaxID=2975482 RepID=UPI0021BBB3F1|nr:hypothetical protein [Paenibacillus andongensis]
MAWSEFKPMLNEYNEEFRSIDESLIRLLKERKSLAKGKRFFPSKEIIQEWASSYEMDIPQINWLIHSLNEGSYSVMPDEPGELLSVIPIMQKSIVDDFEYQLTHSMQHKNGSIIFLEIKLLENGEHIGHIRPQLLLEVKGSKEYQVRRNGSHGGGGQAQVRYLVTPQLPNNISEISFALKPYAIPMENPPKEIILDKEVNFE